MGVFRHELRRGKISLIIWTAVIAAMLGLTVLIYPQMAAQMKDMADTLAQMGDFSAAFGLDALDMSNFSDYFASEFSDTMGLGGALFAALLGMGALAKEEREHTAEFLLTHPLTRRQVVAQKGCAVAVQILLLNLAVALVTGGCMAVIGESVSVQPLALLLAANVLMQLEIACLTFCLSAFVRRGGVGIGLGLVLGLYFCNVLANLTDDAAFLKYVTPFGYTGGAAILADRAIPAVPLAIGMALAAVSVAVAFWHYSRKDIV